VFGSDICTCRPYLIYGIEEAVKEAQKVSNVPLHFLNPIVRVGKQKLTKSGWEWSGHLFP